MKKMTLSILAVTAIVFLSCSKDSGVITESKAPEKKISAPVTKISGWLSMNFVPGFKYNAQGLEGTYYFNPSSIYDEQETTRLAFIRTADARTALPANVLIDGDNLSISYLLTYDSFTIMVNNANEVGVPDANKLTSCQFRYIVVPNSVINAHDIDWTNYSAVAQALEIGD